MMHNVTSSLGKVLIVDDDDAFTCCLRKALFRRKSDPGVIVADDGEVALSLLNQNDDIKLVLLDMRLPKIDGLELLSLMKDRWPERKVIVMSGDLTPYSEESLNQPNVATCVSKPFEVPFIRQLAEKAMGVELRRQKNETTI